MKKFSIIMTFVALFAATSCTSLTGVADSAAAATGSSCAKALLALRASHKAGTLSIANATDLSNILVVVGAYNALQTNKSNNAFRKSFTSGMVSGGSGIITNSNVGNTVSLLMMANGLNNVTDNNISSTGKQTTNAVLPVLNAIN